MLFRSSKRYRSTTRRRRILLGYAAPLTGTPFRADLAASIQDAAAESNVDLIVLDNRDDDPDTTLKNAQVMIEARVDVALLFQPYEWIGHAVADRIFHPGIPFITIDVPLHGGIYFGANNYQAGRMAGQVLARFAAQNGGGSSTGWCCSNRRWRAAMCRRGWRGCWWGCGRRWGRFTNRR